MKSYITGYSFSDSVLKRKFDIIFHGYETDEKRIKNIFRNKVLRTRELLAFIPANEFGDTDCLCVSSITLQRNNKPIVSSGFFYPKTGKYKKLGVFEYLYTVSANGKIKWTGSKRINSKTKSIEV